MPGYGQRAKYKLGNYAAFFFSSISRHVRNKQVFLGTLAMKRDEGEHFGRFENALDRHQVVVGGDHGAQ